MDSTKLIALAAGGASSSSILSGSFFSGSASSASTVKLQNPYQEIDLNCVYTKKNNQGVFTKEIEKEPEFLQVKTEVWDGPSPAFNLPSPTTPVTGTMEGCLRVGINQLFEAEEMGKGSVLTMEMTAIKGNHGIILANVITNLEKYGGPASIYRLMFLEKGTKWEIKAGVQWSDATFPGSAAYAKRLEIAGLSKNNKEFDWIKGIDKKHMFSLFWKQQTPNKNIYQELTIKIDGKKPSKTLDFWNEAEEPLALNSNLSRPSAIFDASEKKWKRAGGTCDVNRVKEWLNLFKEEKGSWA